MKINSNNNQQNSLLFIHIPKAGGSTLNSIIQRHYDLDSIFKINGNCPKASIDKFKNLTEAERKRIKLVNGHMSFGLHDFLPNASTYITMLRHPVERIISHYYYVLRTPNHYLHDKVTSQNMNLKDYISSGISQELENDQTRLLSGIGQKNFNLDRSSNDMLEAAKRNLTEKFVVVGLTEKFDETLILLQEKLGFKHILYIEKNVTKDRPKIQNISEETAKLIKQKNQLDIELYKYAESIFNGYDNLKSSRFKLKLNILKALNIFYNKYFLIEKKFKRLF